MINESLKSTGQLKITVRDKDGNIKEERLEKNLVVQTGLDFIASRMAGTSSAVMSHMEVGTDNTAAANGQTALLAAVGSSRTALTSTTVTNNTVEYVCTFGAGTGTGALTEAGIFNAASAGTMLCRTVFAVVNKGADDSVTITWTITISG